MANIWNIYSNFYDNIMGNAQKNDDLFNYIKQNIKKSDYLYDGANVEPEYFQ